MNKRSDHIFPFWDDMTKSQDKMTQKSNGTAIASKENTPIQTKERMKKSAKKKKKY